jgi:hypothetical protein
VDRASAWVTARISVSPLGYATFSGVQPDMTDDLADLPLGEAVMARRRARAGGLTPYGLQSPHRDRAFQADASAAPGQTY